MVNPCWIDDKITKGIFADDDKYIVPVNYIEFILNKNLNKNEIKCSSYTKEINNKFEDDFDFKFNKYIDSKMESIKSQKTLTNKNNKELYYPLFDKNLRIKRSSNSKNNSNNVFTTLFSNDKNKNIKRNKSSNLLSNQTTIEFKNNEITFGKKEPIRVKFSKKTDNINLITNGNFRQNNKIYIYTYNCSDDEIASISNYPNFEFKKQITSIANEFNKEKDILLINYDANKYNYIIYKYLFDKIAIIDLFEFIIQFINEDFNSNLKEGKNIIIKKINDVLLINKFNIMKIKSMTQNHINENNINFILSKNIPNEEYNILEIIMKKYLKANLNANSEKNEIKTSKSDNCIFDHKIGLEDDKTHIKLKAKTYIITKMKANILNFVNTKSKIIINSNYVYDSFLKGYLIDLENEENLETYLIK